MNKNQADSTPRIFLTMADYYGTLAAARCLGQKGIGVTMGEWRTFVPALWSKFVDRKVKSPAFDNTDAFMTWLVAFGTTEPGHVLYPTSDDLAWLFAHHARELAPFFKLYQPDVACIYTLLNKAKLDAVCTSLGIAVPETHYPESEAQLAQIAGTLTYPVLIKPRSQILFKSHIKGSLVNSEEELLFRYKEFFSSYTYEQRLIDFDPSVKWPMVQAYYPDAAENIYSVSGFIDATGELCALRASRKVLQRPRKLGIGLCFEAAPVRPELADAIRRLCKETGYFGTFEVEFIHTRADDAYLLTDFNPRFFSQMAFDVDRGLPLPEMAYLAATNDQAGLHMCVTQANVASEAEHSVYCHSFIFKLLIWAQTLTGKLSKAESAKWRTWFARNRASTTDAVRQKNDPWPARIDTLLHVLHYAKHPRYFIRSIFLDR